VELARDLSLVTQLVTTGLMAGIYLGFSIAVMPGLARGSDRTYVDAMRGMNTAILGWFFVVFLGPLPLGIVGVVNVPLNNRLDTTEPVEDARSDPRCNAAFWSLSAAYTTCGASITPRYSGLR